MLTTYCSLRGEGVGGEKEPETTGHEPFERAKERKAYSWERYMREG